MKNSYKIVILTLSLMFVFAVSCQKAQDSTAEEQKESSADVTLKGLADEEIKAVQAQEELAAEETITEENAKNELEKLKSEIENDK
ncbi:MAG: hypothetical protein JXR91_12235 [Deltaproteobacteria bacterium]|nr:hypothetical protein [Deltaproteobacteria bacterium]